MRLPDGPLKVGWGRMRRSILSSCSALLADTSPVSAEDKASGSPGQHRPARRALLPPGCLADGGTRRGVRHSLYLSRLAVRRRRLRDGDAQRDRAQSEGALQDARLPRARSRRDDLDLSWGPGKKPPVSRLPPCPCRAQYAALRTEHNRLSFLAA